jgi:DNA polymerase III subunit epsilon
LGHQGCSHLLSGVAAAIFIQSLSLGFEIDTNPNASGQATTRSDGRLKTQNKFWWFVLVAITVTVVVFLTIVVLFWQQLTQVNQKLLTAIFKEDFAYFFVAGVLLFTAFGFTLDWFFRFYIIPVNQLTEETLLIITVNPRHRIKVQGSYDIMRLAEIINQCAEKQITIEQSVSHQLQAAKKSAEVEKNILAALLEGLPQGLLVCNLEGQIVFYNRKMKALFSHPENKEPHWMGLGRSVFGIVEETLIERALERIGHQLAEGKSMASERFLMGGRSKSPLPAEILPVLDSQHHITGFIIYVEDSVARFKKEQELFANLQAWQHKLTQSVSVIKTTAEVLKERSPESERHRDQLIQILAHESNLAAEKLSKNDILNTLYPNRPWPLTAVDAGEWSRYLVHRAGEVAKLDLHIETTDLMKAQISIDMYYLTNGLLFVLQNIGQAAGIRTIQARFYQLDAWLYLDLIWEGRPLAMDELKQWKCAAPSVQGIRLDISLADILAYHGAKLWLQRHLVPDGFAALRFLLPALERSEMASSNGHVTILPDSRPEFYDFNLFQQAGQTPEWDNRSLAELACTAFDTETTGLDPLGGDEIISIGAVRIVNGRILQEERFDQLINPMRHLPWASVKYHGIRPEMLSEQPTIDQVLPVFYEFAKNTVMVGHNVAFDMRMLQLKESSAGIQFINPVLDTMLLSALVHPAQHDHSLNSIADRLGIQIVGRHTALGDAIATGQIFLKFIPLLNAKGIFTLMQARQASEKTLYARLKY